MAHTLHVISTLANGRWVTLDLNTDETYIRTVYDTLVQYGPREYRLTTEQCECEEDD